MKCVYIDTETTGVDPKQHGIIQLSGFITIHGERVNTFNFKMQPFPGQPISPQALEVNRVTVEDLKKYDRPEDCYKLFVDLLTSYISKYDKTDKFFFVAYNAPFDSEMVRNWLARCGDNYYGSYFYSPALCTMNLAGWHLAAERSLLENFKLGTVAKFLGIKTSEGALHDGLYDIELAYKIEQVLNNLKTQHI